MTIESRANESRDGERCIMIIDCRCTAVSRGRDMGSGDGIMYDDDAELVALAVVVAVGAAPPGRT